MGPRILLVEDSDDQAELIGRLIERAAPTCELHRARAAREAMAALQTSLPTLVLVDLNLGTSSGIDLIAQIKACPELNPARVVVLTTSRDDDDVRAAYQAGANGYLVKPPRFSELERLIDRAVGYWLYCNVQTASPGNSK